jgi:hypothetical protein
VVVAGDKQCSCAAGFTGDDGGPCVLCAAGFYKEAKGSGGCQMCAEGTSSGPASTLASDCKDCKENTYCAGGAPVQVQHPAP